MSVKIDDFYILLGSFAQDVITGAGVYRNGYAIYMYSSFNNKTDGMKAAVSALDEHFQQVDSNYLSNKDAIYTSLSRLKKRLYTLKKSLDLNWKRIQDLLMQPFKVPVHKKRQLLPLNTDNILTLDLEDQEKLFPPHVATDQQTIEKQLKTDCEKCSKIRKSYMKAISELKVKLRSSRKSLKEMSKLYNVKHVNQNMKRKDAARDKLRIERQALKKENFKLKNEVKRLKTILAKENFIVPRNYKSNERETNTTGDDLSKISLEIQTLIKKIQTKENTIQKLGLEVDSLRCELKILLEKFSVTKIVKVTISGYPELGPYCKRSNIDTNLMQKHDGRLDDKISYSKLDEGTSNKRGWHEIEKFKDIPANVAIEIEEQTYITVLDNGALELWIDEDSGEGPTNPADVFTTIKTDNSKIAFKSVNGKYWSLQTDGRVVSIAETVGTREQFEPLYQDGRFALIGCNNCFLSYNDDGDIVCEICTAEPKIWFNLISNVARMKDLGEGDHKESKDANINLCTFKALNHC